jgi:hypothetical protein
MLENIVPLSGNTSTGAPMVLQVVDPGFHSVPLHRNEDIIVSRYSDDESDQRDITCIIST